MAENRATGDRFSRSACRHTSTFAMAASPILAIFVLLLSLLQSPRFADGCFSSIFSIGDSIADTGNLLISLHGHHHAGNPPYGETFFHRPTGRFCDGRLIVDFIAEAMEIPLLRPFLAGPGDLGFRRGVNFAVAGATALDSEFFRDMGLVVDWTNLSLSVQLGWFKGLLPSLCSSDFECRELFSSSLILAGEIGGNDYNYAFMQGKTLNEIKPFVPKVINAISAMITGLIDLGAKTLVVPSDFPIGCVPGYLTMFQSSRAEDYNKTTGCINWLNEFSEYHNNLLKQELERIRVLRPHAIVIYADYYNAVLSLYSHGRVNFSACCGGGGYYNWNKLVPCGEKNATACDNPSAYISWDGMHFTESTYHAIALGLLEGPYSSPSIREACKIIEPVLQNSQGQQEEKLYKME